MPQADEGLRGRIRTRFGSIDTSGPEKYLKDAGYELARSWTWSKSGVTELRDMSRDEFECLLFLVHEWDYGGLTPCTEISAK